MLLASSQSMNNVAIACSFIGNISYSIVGSLMTCSNNDGAISIYPDSYVTQAYYSNKVMPSESTDQIRSLYFSKISTMRFIPAGLKKRFPFMKALVIRQSGLLSVDRENMMQFGVDLEYLDLYNNVLSYLDADVLMYNTHLQYIDFRSNPIRQIEPDFFFYLRNLYDIKIINIYTTYSSYIQNFNSLSGHNLTTFKWYDICCDDLARVETKLAPIGGRIEHSLKNEMSLGYTIERSTILITEKIRTNAIQSNYTEKFNSLTNSVDILVNENRTGKIDKLNSWIGSLEITIEMMKNQMESIDMKLDRFIRIYAGNTVLSNHQP